MILSFHRVNSNGTHFIKKRTLLSFPAIRNWLSHTFQSCFQCFSLYQCRNAFWILTTSIRQICCACVTDNWVCRTDPTAQSAANGRKCRFLANVDPIDVARALDGLHQEETLVVIISKTFTTAETMLNARTLRTWLTTELGEDIRHA